MIAVFALAFTFVAQLAAFPIAYISIGIEALPWWAKPMLTLAIVGVAVWSLVLKQLLTPFLYFIAVLFCALGLIGVAVRHGFV